MGNSKSSFFSGLSWSRAPSFIAECNICRKMFYFPNSTPQEAREHIKFCISERNTLRINSAKQDTEILGRIRDFRQSVNSIRPRWQDTKNICIVINRNDALGDSLVQLAPLKKEEIRTEFSIDFANEAGRDAGGLTREWLFVVAQALFSENLNLFKLTNTEDKKYTIVQNNFNHELYYFAGKIIGKAIIENIPLPIRFSEVILKKILNIPSMNITDIECIDIDLFHSLNYMLKNNVENVFFETFSVTFNNKCYEFVQGGSEIQLTEENKQAYVALRSEFELVESIRRDCNSLCAGIFFVIPEHYFKVLSTQGLDFIISGSPTINVSEWQQATEYKGEFTKNHQIIIWFWELMHCFTQDQLQNVLIFVTGTSGVPVEGFQALKTSRGEPAAFTIQSSPYYADALPRAHTCFNRLDLPLYNSRAEVEQALNYVLQNHLLGFNLD